MKNRLKKLLATGDRLELSLDGADTDATVETAFEAHIDSDRLIIRTTLPTPSLPAHADTAVTLRTLKDSAGILEMRGRIIQRTPTGSADALVVELSGEVRQTQRRQDYRLPLLREVCVGNACEGFFEGLTQNISAGGVRCIIPARIRPGARITVKLDLESESLDLRGEVLDAWVFDEDTQRHILRVRFVEITEKTRSRLAAFIFSEQSRQKKIFD